MPGQATLLIDLGDLPSLVAVTLDPKPQDLILYHAVESDPVACRRRAAAKEHGAAFDVRQVVFDQLPSLEPVGPARDDPQAAQGLHQARLLLRAAAAARWLECPRIVWPHQVGPNAGAVGEAVERANLVAALAELDGRAGAATELVIDLPLVDLADQALVDLAEDSGAPMHAFWPCSAAGDFPCRKCAGCQRWRAAFTAAGVGWPWAEVPA
jgi:hypothetical protein